MKGTLLIGGLTLFQGLVLGLQVNSGNPVYITLAAVGLGICFLCFIFCLVKGL